ncbi:hypothetical protein EJ110_NYTH31369 [Nymphaea thermarum]|nr:hypothetical protein EJ110_NYTH31369 [Nymphaea thermarum]
MAASSSSTVNTNQTEIGAYRSENVPVQVITLRLTKENYFTWSAAMTMGIAGCGRIAYIDGRNPEPARTSGVWDTWFLEDNQVKTWIVNSVSADLQPLILRKKTARDMWVILKQMYGQKKTVIRTYQVMKTVYGIRQGNSSIADYYGALKANMDDVYSYIEAEEQRRLVTTEGKRDLMPCHERSALVSRGPGGNIRSLRRCTHCKKTGHTVDYCWDLHPEKKGNKGRSSSGKTPVSEVPKSSGEKVSIFVDQIRELRAFLSRIDVNQASLEINIFDIFSSSLRFGCALSIEIVGIFKSISLEAFAFSRLGLIYNNRVCEVPTLISLTATTATPAVAVAASTAAAAVPYTTTTVSVAAGVTSLTASLLRRRSCVVDRRRRLASRRRMEICVLRRFLGLLRWLVRDLVEDDFTARWCSSLFRAAGDQRRRRSSVAVRASSALILPPSPPLVLFAVDTVSDDRDSHMEGGSVDTQPTACDHSFGQVYNRKKKVVVEDVAVVEDVDITNLNFVTSPDDPSPMNEELPIALRKGTRSCTSHPIQRFVSYAKLNTDCSSYIKEWKAEGRGYIDLHTWASENVSSLRLWSPSVKLERGKKAGHRSLPLILTAACLVGEYG